MGLDTASAEFVCAAKLFGVDFTNTLMIGRQHLFADPSPLQRIFSILDIEQNAERFVRENQFAEEFFRLMGAKEVSSLDYSSYEGATFVQDMNSPIADHLRNRFSVVYDGGTLEHVFNAPQALKNCMEMIRVGGYFMQVIIANNFMGHGFWQFSPELLFRVFSKNHGYEVQAVLLHEAVVDGGWYLVSDPDSVRKRVQLCNSTPTYILTIAKRVSDVAIFATPPQQSDYVVQWDKNSQTRTASASPNQNSTERRRNLQINILERIKRVLQPIHGMLRRSISWTAQLVGISRRPFDRAYYKRVRKDDLLRGKLK